MRDCKRNGKMRKFCCCKKVFCNTILTKSVYCDIIFCALDNSGAENKIFIGVWLSLVECLVRDQEAGGSNPLTPTREKGSNINISEPFFIVNTYYVAGEIDHARIQKFL